jgi:hypothetical protein
MKMKKGKLPALLLAFALITSCLPPASEASPTQTPAEISPVTSGTPIPSREPFPPGTIFEYISQTGDTLGSVASHFNTSEAEIRGANPQLPDDLTTFPHGFPLQVPSYYVPLTGSPFQILPDSEVVNGPTAVDFDIRSEILRRPGFLSEIDSFAYRRQRDAWNVVDIIALNYSINPRLLLALMEYQTNALSVPFPPGNEMTYPMGVEDAGYRGLFWQLIWAAERLSDGYYGWRTGSLTSLELTDGLTMRVDPWQNAGTVAVQNYFAGLYGKEDFDHAVSPEGFYQSYVDLWGDPFSLEMTHIPGSLQQPELALPFEEGHVWDFTGGPHPAWGTSLPFGALDFAPPSEESGCVISFDWFTAPASGYIVRSDEATVVLDLDGDGDERTGWVIFFYHVATEGRIEAGIDVQQGDLLGHPSCEGGRATGTHVHLARKYNGEWIPAGGAIPFELGGWITAYGDDAYEGTLTKGSRVVPASSNASAENMLIYELP